MKGVSGPRITQAVAPVALHHPVTVLAIVGVVAGRAHTGAVGPIAVPAALQAVAVLRRACRGFGGGRDGDSDQRCTSNAKNVHPSCTE